MKYLRNAAVSIGEAHDKKEILISTPYYKQKSIFKYKCRFERLKNDLRRKWNVSNLCIMKDILKSNSMNHKEKKLINWTILKYQLLFIKTLLKDWNNILQSWGEIFAIHIVDNSYKETIKNFYKSIKKGIKRIRFCLFKLKKYLSSNFIKTILKGQ